jgi:chemotaxis family two-component system response regulator Rcp1
LGFSSVSIPVMNIQGPVLGWQFVNESSIGTTAGSGSNPNLGEDRPSDSPSRPEEQPGTGRRILIVEDNPADVYLIRAAIDGANIDAELSIVKDGEQAIKFFDELERDHAAACPAVVILDINLPKRHGGEVLRYIRNSTKCRDVHVIVVSTSESTSDREAMLKLGANGYFHKPSEYSDFMKLGDLLRSFLISSS